MSFDIVDASLAAGDHLTIGSLQIRAWQAAYTNTVPLDYLQNLDIARRQEALRTRFGNPKPGDCKFNLVARRVGTSELPVNQTLPAAIAESGTAVPLQMTLGNSSENVTGYEKEHHHQHQHQQKQLPSPAVGWIGVDRLRDPDARPGRLDGEIWALYVDPDCWREGIGAALLDAGLDRLRQEGYVTVSLWVLVSNERARRFYTRYGFLTGDETEEPPSPTSPLSSPSPPSLRQQQQVCGDAAGKNQPKIDLSDNKNDRTNTSEIKSNTASDTPMAVMTSASPTFRPNVGLLPPATRQDQLDNFTLNVIRLRKYL